MRRSHDSAGASLLSPDEIGELEAAPLTYPDVGATGSLAPAGYRSIARSRTLLRRDFGGAVEDLMRWRVHQRAGLQVAASVDRVVTDAVVVLRLGPGRVSLRIPCRVVHVIDEPDRGGFAYGTLPGHPECGEERFEVAQQADGSVVFSVTAFSRPASLLAKAGGPISRLVQDAMTTRYLHALDR
jgi:uncharacterized protein (UPF0548 family)